MARLQRESDASCPNCGVRDFIEVETLGTAASITSGLLVSMLFRIEKWLSGIKRIECRRCGRRLEVRK